jgi:glycosyltransferase involved in cell wall biosynthesis
MQKSPRILTTKWIIKNDWVNNTINIYEFCFIQKNEWLPAFIKKVISISFDFINRFDIVIGARLFINRKKFDVIISSCAGQALTYSLLGLLFRKNKKLHFLNEIYLHEPLTFKNKIRPFIYRYFFRNVDFIRVSSSKEIINYSNLLNFDQNRFWFNPWPSHISNPGIINNEEGYIFSAGKQYRDYSTLIKAIKGTGYKLIIVSDRNSMKYVENCDELTVFYDIPKEEYFNLLLKSKIVIVPLKNDFSSCGQVALLEAMSYGKPIIVTKVTGSADYIEDGKSGLFYEKGNYSDLRKKIVLLIENKELRNTLSQQVMIAIKKVYNFDMYKLRYSQFIYKKWQEITS